MFRKVRYFFEEWGWHIALVICIILFIGFSIGKYVYDMKSYNDGICAKCGEGHYEFIEAEPRYMITYHRNRGLNSVYNGNNYFYKCDNCGYVIETYSLFNE